MVTLVASTVLVKVVSPVLLTAKAPIALFTPVAPTAPVNVTAPVPALIVKASALAVLFFNVPAKLTALSVVFNTVARDTLSKKAFSP